MCWWTRPSSRQRASAIAAYRERYGYSDPADPIGPASGGDDLRPLRLYLPREGLLLFFVDEGESSPGTAAGKVLRLAEDAKLLSGALLLRAGSGGLRLGFGVRTLGRALTGRREL